jgi:ArsR family metal-binding transcriptional regulator
MYFSSCIFPFKEKRYKAFNKSAKVVERLLPVNKYCDKINMSLTKRHVEIISIQLRTYVCICKIFLVKLL